MRPKSFVLAFTVIFGILIAGGSAAWVIAAPPDRDSPTATVTVELGEASMLRGGKGDWEPVGGEASVAVGDHVKTGEKSRARLEFFDSSTARLDESTEIIVNDLAVDEENAAHQRVSVGVVAGRLWSRVLKLLDQDSSYAAEVSDVVATVRGTAFVVDATDPDGWFVRVVDSAVGVSDKRTVGGAENLVAAGNEAWFAKGAPTSTSRKMNLRKMAARMLDDAWFTENKRLDDEFTARIKDRRASAMKRIAGSLPGSPFYGLKRVGEKLRLALQSDPVARQALALRYADRRFAEIASLAAAGQRGVAERLIPDLHRGYVRMLRDIETKRISDTDAERLCGLLSGRFMEQEQTLLRTGDGTLRDALVSLPRQASDIPELPRDLRRRLCDRFGERIPTLRPILPTVVPIDDVPTDATGTVSGTADTNVNAPILVPVLVKPTNTNANAPTNTNTSVSAAKTLAKIAVTGQRTILYVPDSQQLRAIATYSDGTTADVTGTVTWTSTDTSVFTAVGGLVLTVAPGSANAVATSGSVSGSYAIRVIQGAAAAAPTLQSVSVSCSPSVISMYGSSTCNATANYSDTSTKNVTSLAAWSTDATLGSMNGSTFTASAYQGVAAVTASYTDGTTQKGSASVTVR